MKPVKFAILCTVLAIAGCGDKNESDTAMNENAMPQQSQQAAGNAPETNMPDASMPDTSDQMAGDTTQTPAADPAITTPQDVPDTAADASTATPDAMAPAADAGQAMPDASDPAAAAAIAPAAGGEATAEADLALGRSIYEGKCKACHATGAAGSPKLDDKANWAPRIAQGMDTLVKHAIEGFKGSVGFMPPKGGFATLTDDEVKAAVAYMVSQAQ
ncbi:MAG TPA: c-type cytochrome [Gammaproteobacteria bacterium]